MTAYLLGVLTGVFIVVVWAVTPEFRETKAYGR